MPTATFRRLPALLCLLLAFCVSCEEDHPAPQVNDGTAPPPPTDIRTERLPGAVRLSYAIPKGSDAFYVLADCATPNGHRQAKATVYDNALILDGFGDTSEYTAQVYAVDRGENRSEPVTVTFRPLQPPVRAVKDSLEVKEDFGGIQLNFHNATEANVVIYVLTPDSSGDWTEAEAYYTSRREGSFSVRGYAAEPRKFALFVRDQWNNYSDTLVVEKTPLFEKMLDKSLFREYRLPGDASAGWGWVMPRLWDGSIDEPNGFHTEPQDTKDKPSGFPHHYSFDLGVTAKLSRFKFYQRGIISSTSFLYAHGNPRKFEIWGSTNPNPDGSFDGWIKLKDCESIKPSGLSIGQVSNEDRAYAAAGEEYVFALDAPAVRYIRVNVLSNWGGDSYSHIMEMTFWGAEQ